MPAWGRRGTFPAVTATLVSLAGVFALTSVLRPLVPPPESHQDTLAAGDYMTAGALQRVRWLTIEADPFTLARRTDRLVLMVQGRFASWSARDFDEFVLGQDEVAERLNREFVCIRVDLDEHPEWTSAAMPVSMSSLQPDPGWSILVLKPNGELVAWNARFDPQGDLAPGEFLRLLTQSQDAVDKVAASRASIRDQQQQERAQMLNPTERSAPDPVTFSVEVASKISDTFGGLPENGAQVVRSSAWRLMLRTGLEESANEGLRPLTKTKLFNWLEGGFFRSSQDPTANRVRYDRTAVSCAEDAVLLAEIGLVRNDPWYTSLARRTLEGALRDFVLTGEIAAASTSKWQEMARSDRYSVKIKNLVARLFPGARRELVTMYNLDPPINETMVPFVSDDAEFLKRERKYLEAADGLRMDARIPAELGAKGLLDESATFLARCTEAWRLLGADPSLEPKLHQAFQIVSTFRSGTDDVVHVRRADGRSYTWAGDYFGYADACLWRFVGMGDKSALEDGKRVLQRAKFLFVNVGTGRIEPSRPDKAVPSPISPVIPTVSDEEHESMVAQAMRVFFSYGTLFAQTDEGREMQLVSGRIGVHYASAAKSVGPRGAGLHLAAIHAAPQRTRLHDTGALALKAARLEPIINHWPRFESAAPADEKSGGP